MSDADLTPEQIARALAGLRRGAWTHHDVVDEREVMIDRTDDMARLAEAIERLTVERDTAISQATWANHAAECAEAAAGAMAEQRDEARLQAEYETDVAAAEIEGRKAAEARVTLLEGALRQLIEDADLMGDLYGSTICDDAIKQARAALTPAPAPVPPGDAPHDAGEAKGS